MNGLEGRGVATMNRDRVLEGRGVVPMNRDRRFLCVLPILRVHPKKLTGDCF